MKIGIIAPIHTPVLSDYPGGIEVFNYNISDELSKRGHDVTLFASGDSRTKAKLEEICPKSLFNIGLDPNNPAQMRRIIYYETNYFIKLFEKIKKMDFDIIHHNHTMILPVYLTHLFKISQVLTLHLASPEVAMSKGLKMIFPGQQEISVVSISLKQREFVPEINFIENIYNGIDLTKFSFKENPTENYMAWMGRFVVNKGPEEAAQVAYSANKKLKMAGKIDIGQDKEYFESIKRKYFRNGQIEFIGPLKEKERNTFLQNAKVFLMPIQWEEPFGLVMIEAMACGTPVVAFNRGSVSEIIEDGVTGFICPPNDIEAMVKAVKKIYAMPEEKYQAMRRACRKHVEENFTVEKMVDNYEKVYEKVLADWSNKRS